ncbi:dTDP-4-amino-4,6-dideoxyglucose formyltransferase [Lutimonas saemankumensis]|uniref:dTDP-4-amino-4,6-dideoxyglucose formyltransferase n=1 Tax=Lutimonas saemankumensis TaxID=483016 RepID=UPI001CD23FEF|nr:dTDP-4-amino-4,6-dideoxyglucose formyltransferase [Lutimonas saemankumensis]MCA0931589.1 dTDP-4-amino-4,6-dideoxyglucose formyltransferase [Lutimonas saemankumensis]
MNKNVKYDSVLVISDNLYLSRELDKICTQKGIEKYFSFGVSPFSNINSFIESDLIVDQYDLRKEQIIEKILDEFNLIISLHCKQIFPKKLVENVRCINIHPGYNPYNRGWYPQVFSILNDWLIGATIHEIDFELDNGPIIDRAIVNKSSWDTSGSLYDRILNKELELIEKNIVDIINCNYNTINPEIKGKVFYKRDFNKLLELDLKEQLTMGDAIKRLRALTHYNYENAFYIDEKTQKKVFIKLDLRVEG